VEHVTVGVTPPYEVAVGPGALAELGQLLRGRRRVAVVSQPPIAEHYGDAVASAVPADTELFLMGDGEEAKTLATVEALGSACARWGLLRGDSIVALGGGVVGDTAGFVAAVYYRGVDVVQVPTTLLAMVDASIGGKTAVNLPEGKNLVGAFHQPIGVIADIETLATLPDRELRCGLGEIAKYALLSDLDLDAQAVLARDAGALTGLVARAAAVKAAVVAGDPQERTGLRATLNLGHTLAHALETTGGYGLAHGEAVAIGLVFAGALAGACERVGPEVVRRYHDVPASLGLPTAVPGGEAVSMARLLDVMRRDKKARGGLTFVLPGPDGVTMLDDPPDSALRTAFAAVGVGVDGGEA
jgi:3-dehydroquinate synthase